MALHLKFPESPHEILSPENSWLPVDEVLWASSFEKLLPLRTESGVCSYLDGICCHTPIASRSACEDYYF